MTKKNFFQAIYLLADTLGVNAFYFDESTYEDDESRPSIDGYPIIRVDRITPKSFYLVIDMDGEAMEQKMTSSKMDESELNTLFREIYAYNVSEEDLGDSDEFLEYKSMVDMLGY